jgi:CubicO group peptidase (beta-lactamase class C family)
MKSGLAPDGTSFTPDIWSFLRTYLAAQNVPSSAPGNVYAYSNTNFTILQALIDILTGHGDANPSCYPTYVSDNVLRPMGINLGIFNPTPDPSSTAALSYSSATDTLHGMS